MKREKNPNQRAFKIVTKKQIVITKPTDEPIPEIDTEKAVAFAMSIAQEMKLRQREADEAHKSESYGICMTCGNLIDRNRLVHSPFVKTCTRCQQTMENEARESRQ